MGREAFRVKIAEIASRRGGGWSPVAACTWQSHRATSCAPDTLCLCIRRIFGWRVDSLQLLPFVRPTDLFFRARPFWHRQKVKLDRGFFCLFSFFFFFVFRVSFRSDTSEDDVSRHLVNVARLWFLPFARWEFFLEFFLFFSLFSLFSLESERKAGLALERNWFRVFVSWGLNIYIYKC